MLFVIFKLAWSLRRTVVTLSSGHICLALLSPEKKKCCRCCSQVCLCCHIWDTIGGLRRVGVWHSGSRKALRLAMEASCWGSSFPGSSYFFGQRVERQAVILANATLMGKEKKSVCLESQLPACWFIM